MAKIIKDHRMELENCHSMFRRPGSQSSVVHYWSRDLWGGIPFPPIQHVKLPGRHVAKNLCQYFAMRIGSNLTIVNFIAIHRSRSPSLSIFLPLSLLVSPCVPVCLYLPISAGLMSHPVSAGLSGFHHHATYRLCPQLPGATRSRDP